VYQGIWYLITPDGKDVNPTGDVIIMYNPGLGHFESVRSPNDQYIFDVNFILQFYAAVTANTCQFKEWNVIRDNSNNIFVVPVIDCSNIHTGIIKPNDVIIKNNIYNLISI
jgi:hypothetical protein